MKFWSPYWKAARIAVALAASLYLFSSGWTLLIEDGQGYQGTRPWFIGALASILVSVVLLAWCWGLAVRSDASLVIHEDRLAYRGWKKPIYFRDIEDVRYEGPGSVHLRLKDGSIQHLPGSLVPTSPRSFQRRLKKAVELHRAAPPPLS